MNIFSALSTVDEPARKAKKKSGQTKPNSRNTNIPSKKGWKKTKEVNNCKEARKARKQKYLKQVEVSVVESVQHNKQVFERFIPRRLLCYIFSLLGGREVLSCSMVCKSWRELILSDHKLWLCILSKESQELLLPEEEVEKCNGALQMFHLYNKYLYLTKLEEEQRELNTQHLKYRVGKNFKRWIKSVNYLQGSDTVISRHFTDIAFI